MNSKISRKLITYFAITLLVFALVIGFTFSAMFKQSTLDQAIIDLEQRAQTIAQSVSAYGVDESKTNSHRQGHMMRNKNLSTYLESLEATTIGEVWIVDKNMKSIGRSHRNSSMDFEALPFDAKEMIDLALTGKNVQSEGFSKVLNADSVSVGVPIFEGQRIIGAVLLHAPLAGIDAVVQHGYHVLIIYIVMALCLSILLAYLLSKRFVKPLYKMKETSKAIAEGDYTVKTNVYQNDEIGDLALSIDELSRQLDQAQQERARFDHLRNEFFADISHELRTPVTIMKGTLETLMLQGQEESKETMMNEMIHLQNLMNDLLDFSKLNSTDFALNKEKINLNQLVEDVIRSTRPLHSEKGISVNAHFDQDITPFVGDYSRLRQMILIVLDNAIKFSPKQGVIDIYLKQNCLLIKDYGPGISEDELPNIFSRFYKKESESNRYGNGIGLAIAKQIALRHDIDLTATSQVGLETCFKFEF
ncbi:HAMP domain-containing sensor histidine kinase [Erysipelothrix urinaevulpis]|uniref:HAMP domain-containing sensor histidine kinase n=1 Tax=Erysipelothrix urinaevulpis TaxID=2683717 RepID=UPI001358464A|nr:HAMP domain-containing sensor histidine kinase [Erysipelothrix urinaevulpis]